MSRPHSLPPAPPGVPVLGNTIAFARDPFGFVRRSVESTGDVFRMRLLGKDVIVVAHPSQVETLLRDRETFAKPDDFEVAFGDALLSVEGDRWKRQRQAMEGFFSPTRIGEFAQTMTAVTDERISDWTGTEVRIDEEMRAIALANLFEVILGESLTDEELADIADAAHALNLWFKPSSWAMPHWVPTPARRKFHRGSGTLREHARSLMADIEGGDDADSLLAKLATLEKRPDNGFDRAEVLDQVVGMLFAGHETTALGMTYALHQIGANPAVTERLEAEIDAETEGRPSLADLQRLEYLDRVIDETLRLYPPVHGIPRRTTEPVTLGEHRLPADTFVLVAVWNMHRDPRFYDEPLQFDPDRWSDTAARDRGYEFVPFGAGPRVCIGRHFARLEMKAVLTSVCRRYRLSVDDDITVAPQMTTQPDGHVTVDVRERKTSAVTGDRAPE